MEKKRGSDKDINSLSINGREINRDSDILCECKKYYEQLYQEDNISDVAMDQYLESVQLENILSQTDREFLDKPITKDECKDALFSMKENKSPGLNGIPSEFFKTFWPYIGDLVYNSIQETLIEGKMSVLQRRAMLRLIHKKMNATT